MFEEDIAPRVCRQTDRALSTSEGPALDSETFGFLLCHPVTFTGEAKASPSKDSVCFLWELKSEAQTLNFTLIPSTFSSGPSRCHASVLSPSILGRGLLPEATLSILELPSVSEVCPGPSVTVHSGTEFLMVHVPGPHPPQ